MLKFVSSPEVAEAKSLISRREFVDLTKRQSPFRYARILLLWGIKVVLVFLVAPRMPWFIWPILALVSIGVVEGLRNWSHESLHQRVFANQRIVNSLLTRFFLSLPIITPYITRLKMHLSHHRNLNLDSDRERFAWQTVMNKKWLLKELLLSLTGAKFIRGALSAREADSNREGNQMLELALLLVYFFSVFLSLYLVGYLIEYIALWILPQIFISPVVKEVRSYAEHGGTGERPISRTTIAGFPERLFLYQVHFGYHFEHHVWPSIPENNLPRVHQLLKQRGFWDRHPDLVQGSGVMRLVSAIPLAPAVNAAS